ncbi:MAG TPA: hypothetical protein VFQ65_09775, partial [Kofleriaceae bacterium]|nr:hypothetical protein [Kofleriaceae bacterium]
CPAVYKYAYLTSAQSPTFGHETQTNPLAWHIDPGIADLDSSSVAYRVRAESGGVILAWTPVAADAHGIFNIALYRDGNAAVPILGTQVGTYYLDTRYRTTGGVETVKSACWQHHPLAAPIDFAAAGKDALFQMTFAAQSPISQVLLPAPGTGVPVVNVPFVQQTAEATKLEIRMPAIPTGTGTKELVDEYALHFQIAVSQSCGTTPCAGVTSSRSTSSAPISGQWQLLVTDDVTGNKICLTSVTGSAPLECTIPARSTTEAPHGYHLVLDLSAETSIAPPTPQLAANSYFDYTVALLVPAIQTTWITAGLQADLPQGCSKQMRNIATGVYTCSEMTTYNHYVALNQAKLQFDSIQLSFAARAGDATTELPLGYVPAGAKQFTGMWNAGNDGL